MKRTPQEIVGCKEFGLTECQPCQYYQDCLTQAKDAVREFDQLLKRLFPPFHTGEV
jgi:hypothetical protein